MNRNYLSATVTKLLPLYPKIMKRFGFPTSLTLIPTNKCNLRCSFCSNKERDKGGEIPYHEILRFIDENPTIDAVEISGGGDPLCYPHIKSLLRFLHGKGIKIGLITNGIDLLKIRKKLKYLSWLRISVNGLIDKKKKIPFEIIPENLKTGLAYIIHDKSPPHYVEKLKGLVRMYNFSYGKLCVNCYDEHKTFIEEYGDGVYKIDRELQPVENPCYMGSIKPVLTPDGLFSCSPMVMWAKKYEDKSRISIGDSRQFKPFECPYDRCALVERNRLIKQALDYKDPDACFL